MRGPSGSFSAQRTRIDQVARSRWLKFDEGLDERDDISVAVLLKGAHLRPHTAHEQGRQEL